MVFIHELSLLVVMLFIWIPRFNILGKSSAISLKVLHWSFFKAGLILNESFFKQTNIIWEIGFIQGLINLSVELISNTGALRNIFENYRCKVLLLYSDARDIVQSIFTNDLFLDPSFLLESETNLRLEVIN